MRSPSAGTELRALRPGLRRYLLSVITVGAVTPIALARVWPPHVEKLGYDLSLAALIAIALRAPVQVARERRLTLDDAGMLAASMLLFPTAAVLTVGLGYVIGLGWGGREPHWARAFNVAKAMVGTAVGAATFRLLGSDWDAALVGAGLAYAGRMALVDLAIALHTHRDPRHRWWAEHRLTLLSELVLVPVTVAIVGSAPPRPLMLVGIALSSIVLLLLFREVMRARPAMLEPLFETAELLELGRPSERGHAERTSVRAVTLARRMGLAPAKVDLVRDAARLHELGRAEGTLDGTAPGDPRLWHTAPERAAQLIERTPALWEIAEIVRLHQERPDGLGHPYGLRGEAVRVEASIVSLACHVDRTGLDPAAASIPERERGTRWPAAVVDAFDLPRAVTTARKPHGPVAR